MSKKNYHNIIDFGSSKIRMTVFDEKLNNLYSDSIFRNLSQNNLLTFNDLKQKVMIAEKKISSHIEDSILMLDNKDMFLGDGLVRNKSLVADNTCSKIDNEVINISKIALNNAVNIIRKNRILLEKLVEMLINLETIDKNIFKKISFDLLEI